MKTLQVQVITYAPTVFYHCQHCELTFQHAGVGDRIHRQHARESLPDDLRDEFHQVSDWIHSVTERHGERVRVKVVDAASLEGFWKSMRYRAGRYPFVVVDGRHTRSGTDFGELDRLVDQTLQEQTGPEEGGAAPRAEPFAR